MYIYLYIYPICVHTKLVSRGVKGIDNSLGLLQLFSVSSSFANSAQRRGKVFRAMTRWFPSFFLAAVLAVIPSVAEIPDIEACEDSRLNILNGSEWI